MSRNRRGLTTTQRGYGWDHARRRAAAFVALPEWSPCARCQGSMWKFAKDRHGRSALHWDHTDTRSGYLGFSHQRCNGEAAALKANRVRRAKRLALQWHSRVW